MHARMHACTPPHLLHDALDERVQAARADVVDVLVDVLRGARNLLERRVGEHQVHALRSQQALQPASKQRAASRRA